ncbi:MAG: hypothetical protein K6U03_08020, partial [Firmicutes bacterium]|nr:hypothetical protein [Bacillota bacterium]
MHRFAYDALGRLVRDEDPAGGAIVLERTKTANGYQVKKLARVGGDEFQETTYTMEYLPTGEKRMTVRGCCGGPTTTLFGTDGSRTTTYSDGIQVKLVLGPDPRFGMQAPIVKEMTVKTPGGLTYTQTAARSVTLAEPGNPLSLQTMTDTITINGRTYTTTYAAATQRITSTTPEGRQSFTSLDEKGRIIRTEVPGLAPVAFEYDTRGRLTTITEGTGIEARISRINYNAQGYVESITDPMNRTIGFEYDLAGRVTAQIRADGKRITYIYDQGGNVTSITPPGRPTHRFTYTPVDLEETYNPPPVVGGGTNQTRYDYNLNRQVIQITRPDGQTIGFAYN